MATAKPARAPNHWRVALFELTRDAHMVGAPLHTLDVCIDARPAHGAGVYGATVVLPGGSAREARGVVAQGVGVEGALRMLGIHLAPYTIELIPPKCLSRWEMTAILRSISELTDPDVEFNDELMLETIEKVNDLVGVCLEGSA